MKTPTAIEAQLLADHIANGKTWDFSCRQAGVRFELFLQWLNNGRTRHPEPECRQLVIAIENAGKVATERQLTDLNKQRNFLEIHQ